MTAMKNLAYRNHPALTKAAFVAECRAHREADRLVKGVYSEGDDEGEEHFRGCAVGCAVRTIRARTELRPAYGDHKAYADLVLGGRVELAFLEDKVFEALPLEAAREWPERFAEAIPDSADLSGVASAFLARMLREIALPVVPDGFPDVTAAVERVAAGLETGWSKDDPAGPGGAIGAAASAVAAAASETARAAGCAAGHAADYAAAGHADAYAADNAARAVGCAAADAACDAARAAAFLGRAADYAAYAAGRAAADAARASGRASAYARMANVLCDCLAAAPVPAPAMEDRP